MSDGWVFVVEVMVVVFVEINVNFLKGGGYKFIILCFIEGVYVCM